MTEIFYTDTAALAAPELFERLMLKLSEQRRKKVISYRAQSSRYLSAGAGLLLSYALSRRGIDEKSALLAQGEFGKPYLAEHHGIDFSLSHSGSMALCAISDFGDVGCDIEAISKNNTASATARRFFCKNEYEHIINSKNPSHEFIRLWTLKESYIKALGTGLSTSLSSFEIIPSNLPSVAGAEMFFYEFTPNDDYRAAVCAASPKFSQPKYVSLSESFE